MPGVRCPAPGLGLRGRLFVGMARGYQARWFENYAAVPGVAPAPVIVDSSSFATPKSTSFTQS